MKLSTFKVLILIVLSGISATLSAKDDSRIPSNTEFESALVSVTSLRIAYHEYWLSFADRPESIAALGYSESDFQTELIEHAGISNSSGAILIGLTDRFGDKQWAALIPQFDGGELAGWVCQTTLLSQPGDSTGCRFNVSYAQVDQVLNSDAFDEALLAISALRSLYSEWYQITGTIPVQMQHIGVDQSTLDALHDANISHVMVDPNSKAMIFGLDDEVFGSNHWASVTPIFGRFGYIARWACRTTLPNELVSNPGCSADQGVEDMLFTVLARR